MAKNPNKSEEVEVDEDDASLDEPGDDAFEDDENEDGGEDEVDPDDASLEDPRDDAFDDEDDDTSNVSE